MTPASYLPLAWHLRPIAVIRLVPRLPIRLSRLTGQIVKPRGKINSVASSGQMICCVPDVDMAAQHAGISLPMAGLSMILAG